MFSLIGLTEKPNRKAASARGRIAAILLQGIARHALTRRSSWPVTRSSASKSYGASTERFIADEGKQARDALVLLADSLLKGYRGAAEDAGNLRDIRAELENAPATGDLAQLNAELRFCLAKICNEVDALRRRNGEFCRIWTAPRGWTSTREPVCQASPARSGRSEAPWITASRRLF